jgi:hypothetical protein
MLSTIVLIVLWLALFLLSFVLWAVFLRVGLRWAKVASERFPIARPDACLRTSTQITCKRKKKRRNRRLHGSVNRLFLNTALFILLAADDMLKALLQAVDGQRDLIPAEAVR